MSSPGAPDILWIVVVGGIIAWFMAYGIGANDVANAFGTSVGSRTLKLKWAVLIAAIMETCGAVFLGGSVASTIRGGVASPTSFESTPDIFAYGMLCALTAAATWLLVATYWELPVSTTHSIIGGVLGFALVYGGASAVIWAGRTSTFPFYTGVVVIVASWFFSPVISGVITYLLFLLLRVLVLRGKNAPTKSIWCLPALLLFTLFVNIFFILYKGVSNIIKINITTALWAAAVAGLGGALLGAAIGVPLLLRQKKVWEETIAGYEAKGAKVPDVLPTLRGRPEKQDATALPKWMMYKEVDPKDKSVAAYTQRIKNSLFGGLQVDIFAAVDDDVSLAAIHDNAEKFTPQVEQVFKSLQIISACAMAFAHGANDVANAVGPFAAIYSIYQDGYISRRSAIEPWMLAGIGASGIVVGLATYGWKIVRVLGVKLTAITPSRGFTIETSTAIVTSFGSYLGIPLSTTQCQVGATAGVGLAEGRKDAIKWSQLAKMFAAWVFTLVIGGVISGVLFAWGTFAPSKLYGNQVLAYQTALQQSVNAQLAALQKGSGTPPPELAKLSSDFTVLTKKTSSNPWPSTTRSPYEVTPFLNDTTTMMVKYSNVTFP